MSHYEAWFDGACEPTNPGGTATYGVTIKMPDGTVGGSSAVVGKGFKMSNNVAEYAGVIHVLEFFTDKAGPEDTITIHGDSMLVIEQLSGRWGARKGLYMDYYRKAVELLRPIKDRVKLVWIPREQNEECDRLSRTAGAATTR